MVSEHVDIEMARIFTTEEKGNIIPFPKKKRKPLDEKTIKMETILKELERRGITDLDMCITLVEAIQDGLPELHFFAAEDQFNTTKNNLDLVLHVLRTRLQSKIKKPS